jgi:glutamyl-tRNA reductase
MNLSLLSFSFKNTAVELRERLTLSPDEIPGMLAEYVEHARLQELMLLSTCNRVEYYFAAEDEGQAFRAMTERLQQRLDPGKFNLADTALKLSGRPAMSHLFRVASSLESMVIGEPQILGQVKEAYRFAVGHRLTGPLLNGLMPQVFRTAKRVRTETQIARFPVSISYVAVELAGKIFDDLASQTVMVIGAGEMAELAITHLVAAGVRRLIVTNRTFANAVSLAERFQGSAVPYEQMAEHLAHADIVISSTGARGFIVTPELARQAVRSRRGKPMFFIDIAVPRDIDPAINGLSNVYLYDIDDLQAVAASNLAEREREALAAESILAQDLDRYLRWYDSLSVVPTVKALRERFAGLGEQELERALAQLKNLTPQDAQQVRRLVHSVVNKLLHVPSMRLKQLAEERDGRLYAQALSALFDLSPGSAAEAAETAAALAGADGPEAGANVLHLPVAPKRVS